VGRGGARGQGNGGRGGGLGGARGGALVEEGARDAGAAQARPRGLAGARGARAEGGAGLARAGRGTRAARGRKKGGGGREIEGKGREKTHLRGSKLRRSRLQTLGHHGERERGGRGRGRLLHGRNQMSQTDLGEGGARGEGRGARAGLSHTVDRNPRHARPLNGIRSRTKSPKRGETNTRHQTKKCASA
jgi:hypothetical protein